MENTSSPASVQASGPSFDSARSGGRNGQLKAVVTLAILVAIFFVWRHFRTPGEEVVASPTPAPSVSVSPSPDTTAGWKTYTSTTYGYTFNYPNDYGFVVTSPKVTYPNQDPDWNFFACGNNQTGVCATIVTENKAATNAFGPVGLGFAVKILDKAPDNLTTADACSTLQYGTQYAHKMTTKTTINGVSFFVGDIGGAAAGTNTSGSAYRTFSNGKCWELSTSIVTTPPIYDFTPPPTTVQAKAANDVLLAMVKSFKFTNLAGFKESGNDVNGQHLGYIKTISNTSLSIDYIQWLSCDDCGNGFRIVNDNPQIRTFKIAPTPHVEWIGFGDQAIETKDISLTTFVKTFNGEPAPYSLYDNGSHLYWITIKNGLVVGISQQYLP